MENLSTFEVDTQTLQSNDDNLKAPTTQHYIFYSNNLTVIEEEKTGEGDDETRETDQSSVKSSILTLTNTSNTH